MAFDESDSAISNPSNNSVFFWADAQFTCQIDGNTTNVTVYNYNSQDFSTYQRYDYPVNILQYPDLVITHTSHPPNSTIEVDCNLNTTFFSIINHPEVISDFIYTVDNVVVASDDEELSYVFKPGVVGDYVVKKIYLDSCGQFPYVWWNVSVTGNCSDITISNVDPSTGSYIPPLTEVELSATITNIGGALMNISIWYDNGDGACTFYNRLSGSNLSCTWADSFHPGTTYNWSVNVTDGVATANGTYTFLVSWLNCSMNESVPEISCVIDHIPPSDVGDTWLEYCHVVGEEIINDSCNPFLMSEGVTYVMDVDSGLDYGQTYNFQSIYDASLVYGNNYTFTLYQCYENATPTGCEAGYYCSVHSCVFNDSANYTSVNATYTLTITDLINHSAGYTPKIEANYLNGSTPIPGASCYYTSNGFTLALDNLIEDAGHTYYSHVILADASGNRSYIVTCSASGYPTLQAVDHFLIHGGGADTETEITWTSAPTEAEIYSTETFTVGYTTSSLQIITGASCMFYLGVSSSAMTDNGDGEYSVSYTFNHIASYSYYAVCTKPGYESGQTETKHISVYSGGYNFSTTTTGTIPPLGPSPADSWNCSNMVNMCKSGDIFHCIICPFYLAMGGWVFVLFLLFTCAIAYITTETIAAPSLISIVFSAVYYIYLPAAAQIATGLALVFGVTGLLYVLVKG